MAVERRVKPSVRIKAAAAKRIKIILLIFAVVIALSVVALIVLKLNGIGDEHVGTKHPNNPEQTKEAIRAMLATAVSYDGTWIEDEQGRFQVYLPGVTERTDGNKISDYLYTNEAGMAAFGVYIGREQYPTMDGNPQADPNAILQSVVSKVLPDVGLVMYDAKFSGSYDVSNITLGDGTPGLFVTGELQTVLGLQGEGEADVNHVTYNFPLYGFAMLREDWPVFIWGACDPDDSAIATQLETYMKECASIVSGVTNVSKTVSAEDYVESGE